MQTIRRVERTRFGRLALSSSRSTIIVVGGREGVVGLLSWLRSRTPCHRPGYHRPSTGNRPNDYAAATTSLEFGTGKCRFSKLISIASVCVFGLSPHLSLSSLFNILCLSLSLPLTTHTHTHHNHAHYDRHRHEALRKAHPGWHSGACSLSPTSTWRADHQRAPGDIRVFVCGK